MIEGEGLPDAKVRIRIHIPLSFLFIDFSAQVFHDGAGLVIRGHADDATELTIFSLFTGKRRPHTNHNLEIVIATRGLGLEQGILRRSYWRQTLCLNGVSHLESVTTTER